MLKGVSPRLRAPVVMFTYYNPIMARGPENFCAQARDSGASGERAQRSHHSVWHVAGSATRRSKLCWRGNAAAERWFLCRGRRTWHCHSALRKRISRVPPDKSLAVVQLHDAGPLILILPLEDTTVMCGRAQDADCILFALTSLKCVT